MNTSSVYILCTIVCHISFTLTKWQTLIQFVCYCSMLYLYYWNLKSSKFGMGLLPPEWRSSPAPRDCRPSGNRLAPREDRRSGSPGRPSWVRPTGWRGSRSSGISPACPGDPAQAFGMKHESHETFELCTWF